MQASQSIKRVLVVGATGGSGRATIRSLLQRGFKVTAFSRTASKLKSEFDQYVTETDKSQFQTIDGDVLNPRHVFNAVHNHDAVVVTLGITENPIAVRLFGSRSTPIKVRSQGTKNVIDAMCHFNISRLLILSSFGVGNTKNRLNLIDRLFFKLVLKPQIKDTERQERFVKASGLNWLIAQPVHLSDDETNSMPFVSSEGETRKMVVSRQSVGQFFATEIDSKKTQLSLALSGA